MTLLMYVAEYNTNVNVIQHLITYFEQRRPDLIYKTDSKQRTLLHHAVENFRHPEVFKYLFGYFVDKRPNMIYAQDAEGCTVLHASILNAIDLQYLDEKLDPNESLKLIVEFFESREEFDQIAKRNANGDSALGVACVRGNEPATIYLLSKLQRPEDLDEDRVVALNYHLSGKDAIDQSLLHLAANRGLTKVVARLLAYGAEMDVPDALHRTALQVAFEEACECSDNADNETKSQYMKEQYRIDEKNGSRSSNSF